MRKLPAAENGFDGGRRGHLESLFTTSRRLAAAYEADTGNTLRYLGAEHIDSELDHSINESVFFGEPLSADKRAQAQSIVDDHFRSFIAFLDYKYEVNKLALAH